MPLSKRLSTLCAMALAAGFLPCGAQEVKVSGLLQVWYTQMMDSNLRKADAYTNAGGKSYYNLRSEFTENGFTLRRAEIKVSGKVVDEVDFEVMADPSINTSTTNPTILQDAVITWKPLDGLALRLGQMKTLQTYEGNISSSELTFAERSQLARVFGDKRDRGAVASYAFGDPKDFGAKISLGAFNGMSDALSGKGSDTNAQKDIVLRLDMNLGKTQNFGIYALQGRTDLTDKGAIVARTLPGTGVPTSGEVLDSNDKTSNLGAFYVYQDGTWLGSFEYITGLLGRRFASLNTTSGTAGREHLDQKFAGFVLTGAYTVGSHTFAARYDRMNYNCGDDWYGANPYVQASGDYTPTYTEATLGYTYALNPKKVKAANLKLNYILRSKNFLKPLADQTGEQGGNSVVAAFQIAF